MFGGRLLPQGAQPYTKEAARYARPDTHAHRLRGRDSGNYANHVTVASDTMRTTSLFQAPFTPAMRTHNAHLMATGQHPQTEYGCVFACRSPAVTSDDTLPTVQKKASVATPLRNLKNVPASTPQHARKLPAPTAPSNGCWFFCFHSHRRCSP
jgi:hypothetical protein